MADLTEMLSELLGDNPEEKIKAVMGALGGGGEGEKSEKPKAEIPKADIPDGIDISMLKSLAENFVPENDDRAKLLLSLRPYMRESRQKGIDNAVKLLGLSKFGGLFS